MAALHLADPWLGVRQVLASGRFFEAFTQRPMEGFAAELAYDADGRTGRFATRLVTKPGGYFALETNPRDLPDLSSATAVILTLRLRRDDQPDLVLTQQVPGGDLALQETVIAVAGRQLRSLRIAAAPFAFVATVLPSPVLLDGLVLVEHDPESPAAGATVAAPPAPAVVTDTQGRFRIPALPIAETVTLEFEHDGEQTEHQLRPDYSRPTMTATFSVTGP